MLWENRLLCKTIFFLTMIGILSIVHNGQICYRFLRVSIVCVLTISSWGLSNYDSIAQATKYVNICKETNLYHSIYTCETKFSKRNHCKICSAAIFSLSVSQLKKVQSYLTNEYTHIWTLEESCQPLLGYFKYL